MATVIKAENLSKQYRLGNIGTGSMIDDFKRFQYRLMGKEDPFLQVGDVNDGTQKSNSDYVWALKDINFEINQGDVVGIIGGNGAGKSTLLKILSRTTAPTTGNLKVKGRIASLLEVGTGFHGELSGRDNIYLNGAIMGLRKSEINKKLDEIIDFAGVERYLDTPVKRYSSGMYVRLAFAVAAHLEPDILIVDEVLAVGDAEFQKKCLGKMKNVSEMHGRTVLFVSHNMDAVKELCTNGMVLKFGTICFQGSQLEALNYYQNEQQTNSIFLNNGGVQNAPGNNNITILNFTARPLSGEVISISSGIVFELKFINRKQNINLDATFELSTLDDTLVFHHGALITTNKNAKFAEYNVRGTLHPYLLNAGKYKFKIIFGESQRYELFSIENLNSFEVLNEHLGSVTTRLPGVIRPDIKYDITCIDVK